MRLNMAWALPCRAIARTFSSQTQLPLAGKWGGHDLNPGSLSSESASSVCEDICVLWEETTAQQLQASLGTNPPPGLVSQLSQRHHSLAM
jgi:hypothetical protein